MRRALLAALWLFAPAAHAEALPAGSANVSYSVWTVSGASVLLKFMLPTSVARSLTGVDVPLLTTRRVGDYILQHVEVEAAGRPCPAIDQGYDLGKVDPLAVGSELYGFEILFRCPGASGLVLHNHALFAHAPGHVNFARVERGGRSVEQIFTAGYERLRIPDAALQPAGIGSYVRLGAMHLLVSADRLCFLFGVLLLIRRKQEALFAFAAVILGYGSSLLVSAPRWIVPRATLLEAFMGFMVALVAALITLRELRHPRLAALGCPGLLVALALVLTFTQTHSQALMLFGAALFAGSLLTLSEWFTARAWLLPIAVVGFLDGFALPAALTPLPVSLRSQLWMTAGFDLGAALIAALVMGVPLGLFALARRRFNTVRPALVNELAAASLGALGTFWLLSRLYS